MNKLETDNTSKRKMIAAYDIYKLRDKKKLVVQHSYKSLNGYKVYAFSDDFHIGIKTIGGVIHQQFMILNQSTKYSRRYADLGDAIIDRNNGLVDTDQNEIKFKNVQSMIISAISEYISRDMVYSNYINAKNDQVALVNSELIERIKEEEKQIKRIMDRKLLFRSDYDSNTSFELQIKAHSDQTNNTNTFEWSIVQNIFNLETILQNSNHIWRDDEVINALFKYIVIMYYYSSERAFDILFSKKITVRSSDFDPVHQLKQLFKQNYQDARDILCDPINYSYRANSLSNEIGIPNFNYDIITNIGHLSEILHLYELLVTIHKKYVPITIKEIEQNFFGLLIPLGGSKDTKNVLGQVMQINALVERINTLTNESNTQTTD